MRLPGNSAKIFRFHIHKRFAAAPNKHNTFALVKHMRFAILKFFSLWKRTRVCKSYTILNKMVHVLIIVQLVLVVIMTTAYFECYDYIHKACGISVWINNKSYEKIHNHIEFRRDVMVMQFGIEYIQILIVYPILQRDNNLTTVANIVKAK